MSQIQPGTPPSLPPNWPHQRSRSRRKRLQLSIVVLFLLMIATSLFINRNENVQRLLPFITKEAPPVQELHPYVAIKKDELVAEADKLGIAVAITGGLRTHAEQDTLYEQGRSTKGPIVTYVRGGGSYHNYGLAIDFALRTPKGKIIWDLEYDGNRNGESDWMEVVDIAKRLGFSWGGDWKDFKDYPHLQMDFGYSIDELMRGFRPEAPLPSEIK